ncbi:MAG TPA: TlpA disulfide reductase family protein [Pirellulaceae bacterium]|nr:TlpA disulfide reductase family protein [Pirellulaceae bacterium]
MRFVVLIMVAVVLCLAGCGSEPFVPVDLGAAAPKFKLDSITAKTVITSDSLKGDIVVLNFWSTSCVNCLQEIEELKLIHESGRATVVGIVLDDDPQRVQSLVDKKGIKYQVLQGDQEIFERFDGFSIPYTLVLDRAQTVREKFYGPMTQTQFEDVLTKIQGSQQVAMRE